jgi:hypothetical protein
MIAAYQVGQLTLDDLILEFRPRRWPPVPSACPPGMKQVGYGTRHRRVI